MCNEQIAAPCVTLHNAKRRYIETVKFNDTRYPRTFYLISIGVVSMQQCLQIVLSRSNAATLTFAISSTDYLDTKLFRKDIFSCKMKYQFSGEHRERIAMQCKEVRQTWNHGWKA